MSFRARPNHEITYLSASDRKELVKLWNDLRSKHMKIGQQIYAHFFMQRPEMKRLFSFRDMPNQYFDTDNRFCAQAEALVDFLNGIVICVQKNNAIEVLNMCQALGEHHAKLLVTEIPADAFESFKHSMLVILRAEVGQKHADSMLAWRALLTHVCSCIKDAYFTAVNYQSQATPTSSVSSSNAVRTFMRSKSAHCATRTPMTNNSESNQSEQTNGKILNQSESPMALSNGTHSKTPPSSNVFNSQCRRMRSMEEDEDCGFYEGLYYLPYPASLTSGLSQQRKAGSHIKRIDTLEDWNISSPTSPE